MAARRLIIVMLLLLGISTGVAIVAPGPERAAETETSGDGDIPGGSDPSSGASAGGSGASTTGTDADDETGATGAGQGATGAGAAGAGAGATDAPGESPDPDGLPGDTVAIAISVPANGGKASVCARPDSRLVLTVRTTAPIDLAIPEFGRTASATKYAPAVFDLLLPGESQDFEVTELGSDRAFATIRSDPGC